MKNLDLALDLLIALTGRAQRASQLIANARAREGDLTDDELNGLVADDDSARARLQASIDRARAEGR